MIRIFNTKPDDYPEKGLPDMEGRTDTTQKNIWNESPVARFGFYVALEKILVPFHELWVLPHEAEEVFYPLSSNKSVSQENSGSGTQMFG